MPNELTYWTFFAYNEIVITSNACEYNLKHSRYCDDGVTAGIQSSDELGVFRGKGVRLFGAFRKALTNRYNDLYRRLSGKE